MEGAPSGHNPPLDVVRDVDWSSWSGWMGRGWGWWRKAQDRGLSSVCTYCVHGKGKGGSCSWALTD